MAIHVRNKDGVMETYKIVGLKGENGVTPDIQIGTVTTLEAGQQATVTREGTDELPIFNFGIPKGADGTGGGSASIDDSTISTNKTWSSSKIEDFVLTNVGAIWKDITGGQVTIDSTMDGFLREVEISGNTTQDPNNLSDIKHLGVWNEEKQGYEIEITVSNSSNEGDLNYKSNKTTILTPCQLMKVGGLSDRLYWDKDKGRYVVEKNIEIYKPTNSVINNLKNYVDINNGFQALNSRLENDVISKIGGNWNSTTYSYSNLFEATNQAGVVNKNDKERIGLSPTDLYIKYKVEKYTDLDSFKNFLISNNLYVLFKVKTPQLIETNITEELKLPTYINNTYISVNGGIQGSIKAKAPVDSGKVIATLQRENIELKATNDKQDELINTTMLATDEMFMMLEPLLAEVLINEKSSSKIVDMYVAMIERGIKKIEDVPTSMRERVGEILNKLEK